MNYWTQISIDYANQHSYLDDLFRVYPTIPEGIRDIDPEYWVFIERAFNDRNNVALIKHLLALELFPVKDSYVAYLRRDEKALERNPKTVDRLCGMLYEMGLNEIYKRASEPKETNRQIGPHFRQWIQKKSLGVVPVDIDEFISTNKNAILSGSDTEIGMFAERHLGYNREKGLDLVARFNGKYIIGEAKFLTDFGGHQNAQFNDAITLVEMKGINAIPVAILDGVLYIKSNNKMHRYITENSSTRNIMSSLVLREFLYQV